MAGTLVGGACWLQERAELGEKPGGFVALGAGGVLPSGAVLALGEQHPRGSALLLAVDDAAQATS